MLLSTGEKDASETPGAPRNAGPPPPSLAWALSPARPPILSGPLTHTNSPPQRCQAIQRRHQNGICSAACHQQSPQAGSSFPGEAHLPSGIAPPTLWSRPPPPAGVLLQQCVWSSHPRHPPPLHCSDLPRWKRKQKKHCQSFGLISFRMNVVFLFFPVKRLPTVSCTRDHRLPHKFHLQM